jgi:sterol desaturase/sphingolipid hydroxylase (fatty acid hydroxylase superfamily)
MFLQLCLYVGLSAIIPKAVPQELVTVITFLGILASVFVLDHVIPRGSNTPKWSNRPLLAIGNMGLVSVGTLCFVDNVPGPSMDLWKHVLILPCCSIVSSVLFYYSHRLLHVRVLYKKIHSIHHQNVQTCAMSGFDAHPVDILLSNICPVLVPIFAFSMHRNFAISFYWMGILNTMIGHLEYKFIYRVFNILLGNANFHTVHHLVPTCNFGLKNGILDRSHGTFQKSCSKYGN